MFLSLMRSKRSIERYVFSSFKNVYSPGRMAFSKTLYTSICWQGVTYGGMIMKKLFVLGVIVATLLVASVVSAKTMRDRWQTGVVGEPPWVRDSAVFVPAR